MGVLKKVGIGLFALLGVLGVVGFMLPTEYEVERSVEISASPARVHEFTGDLNQWDNWGPWLEQDPTIRTTVRQPHTGVGAHQEWTGDSGGGELTFTKTDPKSGVEYELVFIDGESRSSSQGWLKYERQPDGVKVRWGMRGDMAQMPVIGGYFALLMDGMVGPMFERGLSLLKAEAEATKA